MRERNYRRALIPAAVGALAAVAVVALRRRKPAAISAAPVPTSTAAIPAPVERPAPVAAPTAPAVVTTPPRVVRPAQALTIGSIGLMAYSAVRLSALNGDFHIEVSAGTQAFVLGALLLLLAQVLALAPAPLASIFKGRQPQTESAARPITLGGSRTETRRQQIAIGIGIVLLALLTVANNNAPRPLTAALGAHGQVLFWVAGTALVAWGLSGAPRLHWPQWRPHRREIAAALAILAVALFLRVWGLDQLRVFVDEIHVTFGVTYLWGDVHPRLLWGNAHPRLLRPIGSLDPFPHLFSYFVADAIALFGRNLAALRLVPALTGTLTVGALYLLARELFDRRIALAAALLLATLPPFIHFSRLALINIADPLPGTLALFFLARALRRGHQSDYVLAGVMLGLTQYFHEAGRLLFPALALIWLAGLALSRVRFHFTPTFRVEARLPFAWRGLGIALLAALIVAAPLIVTEHTEPETYASRLSVSGFSADYFQSLLNGGDWTPLLEHARDAALAFVRTPDSTVFYGGTTPLVLPVLVPVFLLGIVAVVLYDWARGTWMIAVWTILTALGNGLMVDSTSSVHFIPALPAVALLMTIGLFETIRLIAAGRRTGLLVAALVVGISAAQASYYFGPHLSAYQTQVRGEGVDGFDALLRSQQLPAYSVVHLIGDQPSLSQQYAEQIIKFFADDITVRVTPTDQFNDDYLANLSRDVPQWFFVEPDQPLLAEKIERGFPTVSGPEFTSADVPTRSYLLYAYTPPSDSTRSSP